jgi:hypothetical protein
MLIAFFKLYTALTAPQSQLATELGHTNAALTACVTTVYAVIAPTTPDDDISVEAELATDALCFFTPGAIHSAAHTAVTTSTLAGSR